MSAGAATPPAAVTLRGTGGLHLAASSAGPATGRPVLLIHGGGQTRHSWGATLDSVAAAGWAGVAYDQRGHGDSERPADEDYAYETFARDVVEVCGQLRETHGVAPVVVGASLGGLSGLLAEGELAPGSVEALVLVDVTPRLERAGVDRIVAFMLDRVDDGFASLDEAADAVADYRRHRSRPSANGGLAKNLRRGEDGRWRWHWDPAMFRGPIPLSSAILPERFDDAARRLDVPTLLVRGRESDIVSESTAAHLRELCPHAEFVDVSGAGHMVAGDRNDAFSAAVLDFLAALR